ncbi:putative hydrolase [Sphingomonas changbaiensis NBRC 104936]|uniref:phosphoglycolate phosphatase n=1 Tax=Sphingomonas changbaiensis NBRC 104936 TaxID=1219043 RepID=A0A0E9MM14_9SPHN|nr:HAD family hydrolase [Sphingomonas changbaiensis]GAO38842.1 putative hydrolase [Sphingomonas changbaiensis NBRC 104936]
MIEPFDWRPIKLVAFDVDGTLYAQRSLRLRMGARLLLHSLTRFDRRTLAVLKSYRQHRETLGKAETEAFEIALVAEVARRHRLSENSVKRIVAEWIEERPLGQLAACRYAGVERLFERVRTSGRAIGILSDYPAAAKLEALALRADHIVSAGEVGMLKPHPRGLERLMALAGAKPHQTVLIGDRAERDGEAARRSGAHCLLRSEQRLSGWRTFARFDDPVFDALDATPVMAGA